MTRHLPLLLATSLLAGCNFAPKHVRPDLPVTPAYPAEAQPESGVRKAADIAWEDFFTDAQLRERIALAIAHNRDLRIAVGRVEEARGSYRSVRADQLPELGVGGNYTRSKSVFQAGPGDPVSFTADRFDVGIPATSFEIDFWGRQRNLTAAQRAAFLSSVASERAFRLSLIRDVASAYLDERSLVERIALAERTVTSRREELRIADRRLKAGVTSALDYRQTETLLTQAETELAALRLSLAQARNFTAVLIGSPLPAAPAAPLTIAEQGVVRDIAAGLPSDLMTNRPDIIAAEEDLRAARANVGAARAAFFPTISLTGSIGYASNELNSLFDNQTWSFSPQIGIPIFDWGRREADLDVAKARTNIAVATYEKTVQTAFREVADALAGRRYLAEQSEAQARAVTAARNVARLARLRYDNGVAQYIEVLDAERNLFTAEQAMTQLRATEIANIVSLYVALGGGLGPMPALRK
jgi:multidrug efflux system outer membrane protein